MNDWFDRAFGVGADAVGDAIGDIRDTLIFEAWFGRGSSDRDGHGGLTPAAEADIEGPEIAPDDDRASEDPTPTIEPEPPAPDWGHGIDL